MNSAGRTIRLPCYGITITLVRGNGADKPGSGTIASDLHAAGDRREPAIQRGHRRPRIADSRSCLCGRGRGIAGLRRGH